MSGLLLVASIALASPPAAFPQDRWTPTAISGAPEARDYHTAVWTGTEMIVWRGYDANNVALASGGRYSPSTDTWRTMSAVGAPTAHFWYTSIWTGWKMAIWGGDLNPGGLYDPATDTWAPISTTGSPASRSAHTAIWTGSRMIVWGGSSSGVPVNDGGIYDPATDSWSPMSNVGAPSPRWAHTAVWTGSKMIVWGGKEGAPSYVNTGGIYDPASDTWTALPTTGAPSGREWHTAAWVGSEMLIWGGTNAGTAPLTGARFSPALSVWRSISEIGAPDSRYYHVGIAAGSRLIVWGGIGLSFLGDGGIYDPATNSWIPTGSIGVPLARELAAAVWTGSKMVLWGGWGPPGETLNTGGVYTPPAGANAAPGAIQFGAARFTANATAPYAVITLKRDPSTVAAQVRYDTFDGTGIAGLDYLQSWGYLAFPAGRRSATFKVPILGNGEHPPAATVLLRLGDTQPGGGALGPQNTAVLTIVEKPGTVRFRAAAYAAPASATSIKIPVVRTGGVGGSFAVYDFIDGTATGGADYDNTPGVLTFAPTGAGATTQTITIPILQKNATGAKTFAVTLSDASLGSPATTTVTLLGGQPTLGFTSATYTVKSSQAGALITVRRTAPFTGKATVHYATAAGSATAGGVDYTDVAGDLTFAANMAMRTFIVPIAKDPSVDVPKTVTLTLSSPQWAGGVATIDPLQSSALLTIVDPNLTPTLQFSAATYSVNEATPKALITVKRTGNLGGTVTVDCSVTDGSANKDADYGFDGPLKLTFGPNQAVQTFPITVVNDAVDEGTETLSLALDNPTGGAVVGSLGNAVLNIIDNEPTVQFTSPTYRVSEAAKKAVVTVKRAGSLAGPATVTLAIVGGTATGGGVDYELNPGTLSMAPGQASAVIPITIVGDTVADGPKTIELALSGPTGAQVGTPATATVTINDSVAAGTVQFSAQDYSVGEGAIEAAITVTRIGGTSDGATVQYSVTHGTKGVPATGNMFDPSYGTLTFNASEKTKTLTVPVHQDGTLGGGAFSVDLVLDSPAGGLAVGTPADATLWIVQQ